MCLLQQPVSLLVAIDVGITVITVTLPAQDVSLFICLLFGPACLLFETVSCTIRMYDPLHFYIFLSLSWHCTLRQTYSDLFGGFRFMNQCNNRIYPF